MTDRGGRAARRAPATMSCGHCRATVPHHEGAIAMAKAELDKGTHPGLRKMAKDIIGAQTEEIAQMKPWRKAWYGSAKVPTDMSGHGSMDDMDMGSGER